MTTTANPQSTQNRLATTGVRRLTVATTRIFEGAFSLLHCDVQGDQTYRGVFAVLMFPIHHPDKYISLRYTDEKDKIKEIGIIDDLTEFPAATQQLLKQTLAKHYHEQIIARIYEIRDEFGLLFFDVETQRGRLQFIMPLRHDRAEDYGENGKVLLDVSENRFIVPDIHALSPQDKMRFTSYIYW